MNTIFSKSNNIINWALVVIFSFGIILTSVSSVFAQNDSAATDTTVSKTMKSLFSEAKKVAKKDDENLFTIIMIVAVVVVVIIAVWLSFRPDAEDIAREKKKKDAVATNNS